MSATTAASHTLPLRNCYWVVPGLLLAGEHPNGPTRDKTKDRLKKLLGAGIECFVDLTKPTELLRYDTFLPFYVEYARKSIKDHGLPSGRAQMTEILEYIASSMRAGRPVYVHCRAGIGRTGTVVGCFLAERGQRGDDAIDELNRLWQQCRRSRSWPFIPETDAQAHYVREWTPTLESGFELSSLATAVATVGPMSTGGDVRGGMVGVAEAAGGVRGRGGQADGAAELALPGGMRARGGKDAGAAAGLPGGAGRAAGTLPGGAGRAAGTLPGGAGRAAGTLPGAAGRAAGTLPGGAGRAAGTLPGGAGRAAGTLPGGAGQAAGTAGASARVGSGEDGGRGSSGVGHGAGSGGSARVGSGANGGGVAPRGAKSAAAGVGRTAGAGLRAAAEQARAAVERGEVQVKAPPVPPSTSKPVPRPELERGEISPSIRAEIAEAMVGRNLPSDAGATGTHFLGTRGTAAPNGGEEVPWAKEADASARREPSAESSRTSFGAFGGASGRAQDATADQAADQSGGGATRADGAGASARVGRSAPDVTGHQPKAADSATDATVRQPRLTLSAPAGAYHPPADADAGADADPLLDPHTLAAARGLRERFVGTLFGLAVGDAVAAATQFRRPGTFSPVGDMLGGGPFDLPRGAWSDDTAMALCLAESLLEREGFDARDQVQRYSRWQQDGYLTSTGQCVGITASTARSLALAKWRRGLVFPGSHDPDQLDPEPLSRIASIALFYFSSLETTLLQAVDSARVTCQAPAVLDACKHLARAVNAALSGQPKTKILAEAGPLSETAAHTNNNAATALSAAFWAFSSTDNFRDATLRAANVGGNSDVVASVCGQIAGAHYGATAIPPSWRSGLMQKDLIEGIADRLLAHALVSLSS